MPNYIDDSVIPSFLAIESSSEYSDGGTTDNTVLRIGEVRDIIYASDPLSFSKTVTEYNVFVQEKVNNTGVARIYNNCTVSNLFGSVADKFVWTPRFDPNPTVDSQGFALGYGSKVLLLCISGETTNAVILGAINDQQDMTQAAYGPDKNANPGHYLLFQFNGIDASINDAGEFSLTFNGKTDLQGTIKGDSNATGSFIKMIKDGSIEVSTPGEDQTFTLNHTSKTIETVANEGWNVKVNNGLSTIKSQGLHVGEATDAPILGTTYRAEQAAMNASLSAQLQALTALLTTMSVSFTAALTPLPIPIVGPILATPLLVPFATALAGSIAVVESMGNTIDEFEANAEEYLSKSNLSD